MVGYFYIRYCSQIARHNWNAKNWSGARYRKSTYSPRCTSTTTLSSRFPGSIQSVGIVKFFSVALSRFGSELDDQLRILEYRKMLNNSRIYTYSMYNLVHFSLSEAIFPPLLKTQFQNLLHIIHSSINFGKCQGVREYNASRLYSSLGIGISTNHCAFLGQLAQWHKPKQPLVTGRDNRNDKYLSYGHYFPVMPTSPPPSFYVSGKRTSRE